MHTHASHASHPRVGSRHNAMTVSQTIISTCMLSSSLLIFSSAPPTSRCIASYAPNCSDGEYSAAEIAEAQRIADAINAGGDSTSLLSSPRSHTPSPTTRCCRRVTIHRTHAIVCLLPAYVHAFAFAATLSAGPAESSLDCCVVDTATWV